MAGEWSRQGRDPDRGEVKIGLGSRQVRGPDRGKAGERYR